HWTASSAAATRRPRYAVQSRCHRKWLRVGLPQRGYVWDPATAAPSAPSRATTPTRRDDSALARITGDRLSARINDFDLYRTRGRGLQIVINVGGVGPVWGLRLILLQRGAVISS